MTNPVDPALTSSLSAPASDVPAQQRQHQQQAGSEAATSTATPASADPSQQAQQQASCESKKEGKGSAHKDSKDGKDAGAATDEKLTGAELKKRAKAEKAARRVKEKQEREQGGGAGGAGQQQQGQLQQQQQQQQHLSTPKKGQSGHGGGLGGANVGGASDKGQKTLPHRGSAQQAEQQRHTTAEQKRKAEEKNVAVFGHLYGQQRRASVAGAGKEVHPAVLALGLQMRDYVVCGSSARCVATLLAFKRVFLFPVSIRVYFSL